MTDWKHYDISSRPCPQCGQPISHAAGQNPAEGPKEGDRGVCHHCGALIELRAGQFVLVDLADGGKAE